MSFELMKAETVREVTSSDLFMDAVMRVSQLEQYVPTVRVEDESSKALCAETRAKVKQAEKDLEAMRKTAKAPYFRMGQAIDNLFKPFVESCTKMTRSLDERYTKFVAKEIAEAEKAQKEAMAKEIEARDVESVEPEKVNVNNSVKTDSGETTVRKGVDFEITNGLKLIKAAIDGRTKLPMDVVQVVEAKVRQLVNGKRFSEAQWRKWGVKIKDKMTVATRT